MAQRAGKQEGKRAKRDFKVVLRCCPLTATDALPTVGVESKHIVNIVDRAATARGENAQVQRVVLDNALTAAVSQSLFYDSSIKSLVSGAINGYNSSIILYGDHNTGKTYTLEGAKQSLSGNEPEGILHLATQQILDHLSQFNASLDEAKVKQNACGLFASIMAIADDNVYDSVNLQVSQPMSLSEDQIAGKENIPSLSQHEIKSRDDLTELLAMAKQCRTFATKSKKISGSAEVHVVCTLVVLKSGSVECVSGRLAFFDLHAANFTSNADVAHYWTQKTQFSKQQSDLGNDDDDSDDDDDDDIGDDREDRVNSAVQGRESSLLLFRKIASMVAARAPGRVPYRLHPLTRFLRASLGGENKTSLVVTVSPNPEHFDVTSSALLFANKVKRITNKAVVSKRYIAQRALMRVYQRDMHIEHLVSSSDSDIEEEEAATEKAASVVVVSSDGAVHAATAAPTGNSLLVLPPIGRIAIVHARSSSSGADVAAPTEYEFYPQPVPTQQDAEAKTRPPAGPISLPPPAVKSAWNVPESDSGTPVSLPDVNRQAFIEQQRLALQTPAGASLEGAIFTSVPLSVPSSASPHLQKSPSRVSFKPNVDMVPLKEEVPLPSTPPPAPAQPLLSPASGSVLPDGSIHIPVVSDISNSPHSAPPPPLQQLGSKASLLQVKPKASPLGKAKARFVPLHLSAMEVAASKAYHDALLEHNGDKEKARAQLAGVVTDGSDVNAHVTEIESELSACTAFLKMNRSTTMKSTIAKAVRRAYTDNGGAQDADLLMTSIQSKYDHAMKAAIDACLQYMTLHEGQLDEAACMETGRAAFLYHFGAVSPDESLAHAVAQGVAAAAYLKAIERRGKTGSKEEAQQEVSAVLQKLSGQTSVGNLMKAVVQLAAETAALQTFEQIMSEDQGNSQMAQEAARIAFLDVGGSKQASVRITSPTDGKVTFLQLQPQLPSGTSHKPGEIPRPGTSDPSAATASSTDDPAPSGGPRDPFTLTGPRGMRGHGIPSRASQGQLPPAAGNRTSASQLPRQSSLSEDMNSRLEQERLRFEAQRMKMEQELLLKQQQLEKVQAELESERQKFSEERQQFEFQALLHAQTEQELAQSQQMWNDLAAAMSDPETGVQPLDPEYVAYYYPAIRERTFTGAACVEWLGAQVQGVNTVEDAQNICQYLLESGVLLSIDALQEFDVSDTICYQFSWEATPLSAMAAMQQMTTQGEAEPAAAASHELRPSISQKALKINPELLANAPHDAHFFFDEEDVWAEMQGQAAFEEEYNVTSLAESAKDHPLLMAILYGEPHATIVKLIKQYGPDSRDAGGRTGLSYAVRANDASLCALLVKHKCQVNSVDLAGHTPLLWSSYHGYHKCMEILLRNNASIDICDPLGRSAIHWSTRHRSTKCLELLLKYANRATVNIQDSVDHLTALHWAISQGFATHVKLLIKGNADAGVIDAQGRTAVNYAIHYDAAECLSLIISNNRGVLSQRDVKGRTALHLMCEDASTRCALKLLEVPNLDVNCTDLRLTTPLHWAAVHNRLEIAKVLLLKGGKPNAKDQIGLTPRVCAIKKGFVEMAQLLGGGTDPDGFTAHDYKSAREQSNLPVDAPSADEKHAKRSALASRERQVDSEIEDDDGDSRMDMDDNSEPPMLLPRESSTAQLQVPGAPTNTKLDTAAEAPISRTPSVVAIITHAPQQQQQQQRQQQQQQ
eukprot:m.675950 g.675950  ORF g.675950 m.675950 type:complete len:1695 (+) comp58555_c0_seq10:87-5171(+)